MAEKKPSLNTKIGKYFVARQKKGLNKSESQILAGFADNKHATRIEATKEYQEIKEYYKDSLLNHISMDDIAMYHAENITQDKDRGARNKAIEMALSKIEPEDKGSGEDEKVMVILRG